MKTTLHSLSIALALLALSTLNSQLSTLHAQGTAFTYQGRLNGIGGPVSGTYDIRFQLFNTNSGGVAIGTAYDFGVAVSNGLFTTTVDFGTGVFTGSDSNVLEIAVRTNGTVTFGTLAPRQPLTATPYAITAENLASVAQFNTLVPGNFATVSGGSNNIANSEYATAGGGLNNIAGSYYATVGGGYNNVSSNGYTTVSGGEGNIASGVDAAIGGGILNIASGYATTIAGGFGNLATNSDLDLGATVGGGAENTASGNYAIVAGGNDNVAKGDWATIGGGSQNVAGGVEAAIGGGEYNAVNGQYATVPGGYGNIAAGNYSFAGGNGAQALSQGDFVWADDSGGSFYSTAQNQFCVRAAGGVVLAADVSMAGGATTYHHLSLSGGNSNGYLYGSYPALGDGIHMGYNYYYDNAGTGHVINTGGGTSRISADYGEIQLATGAVNSAPVVRLDITTTAVTVENATFNGGVSDRNAKQDFAPVSPAQILDKVLQLPVSEWSYKFDTATRHVGPMAQDFYAAFNVGTDDRHIAPVDEDGVALAAIQGLNQKLNEKDAEIQKLEKKLDELTTVVKQLAAQK